MRLGGSIPFAKVGDKVEQQVAQEIEVVGVGGIELAAWLAQSRELAPGVRMAQVGHAPLLRGGEGERLHQLCGGLAEALGAALVGGGRPQRSAENGAAGGQRPPRPPDVQRRDVPVADRFLPPGVGADAPDGQVDFDQALGILSHVGNI